MSLMKARPDLAPRQGVDKTQLSLDTYLPFVVNRAASAMLDFSAAEFEKRGLTVPKWRVLFAVWQHQDCGFGDLAKLTDIEPSTLSRLVTAMSAADLVRRRRVTSNLRSVRITLRPKGFALFETMIAEALEYQASFAEGISKVEIEITLRALARIYENVQRSTAERAAAG